MCTCLMTKSSQFQYNGRKMKRDTHSTYNHCHHFFYTADIADVIVALLVYLLLPEPQVLISWSYVCHVLRIYPLKNSLSLWSSILLPSLIILKKGNPLWDLNSVGKRIKDSCRYQVQNGL